MLSLKLLIVLAIGTVLMWIPIAIQSKWYKIKIWKTIPIALLLTIAGTTGTYIWYFIENYGIGRSFYGAVFLVPVFFLLVSKLLRVPYGKLLDLCAPAECVMLAIMKIQCMVDGCCGGRVLFTTADNVAIVFPSQIVEMVNAILVFIILMAFARREKNQGTIYPWYLVVYGVSRFVLNFFRASAASALFGLSVGSIWSVCAIVIGCFFLYYGKNKRTA